MQKNLTIRWESDLRSNTVSYVQWKSNQKYWPNLESQEKNVGNCYKLRGNKDGSRK